MAEHAHGTEAIRGAVLGGVDSIGQGTFMNDENMALMKKRGTWYVPTIIASKFFAEEAKVPGYLPPQVAEKVLTVGSDHAGDRRYGRLSSRSPGSNA